MGARLQALNLPVHSHASDNVLSDVRQCPRVLPSDLCGNLPSGAPWAKTMQRSLAAGGGGGGS